ncbi:MAG: NAD(P)/FAD-dependent oxidoreductase [Geobacteraceae bacterium]|nr:NAD(P)/FAD-dependent oxidoreductase [Geobacteraceae bacterium]
MTIYDDIVVGSGASGLTMALLLAMGGRRVLILEKAPLIGGSLSMFSRGRVRFDTGFHFTGGLNEGGILSEMLTLLGMKELVEPVFLTKSVQNRFVFEESGKVFEQPPGIEPAKMKFKADFPSEGQAIDAYFEMIASVCNRTPSMNIQENLIAPPNLEEDYVSLDSVLKKLTGNPLLRGLLSGYAMCYGVRPDEISFANHARMVNNFYESIAFVKDGGDGLIMAFKKRLDFYGVDIRCGVSLLPFSDIKDGMVNSFTLTNGESVSAERAVFTIHPQEILSLIPEKSRSRAFASRISSFESSAGFFSVFAKIRNGAVDPEPDSAIISLFPDNDVNALLSPEYCGKPAVVIIKPPHAAHDACERGVCILEPAFPEKIAQWGDSTVGKRSSAYSDYKEERVEAIRAHIAAQLPAYSDVLEFVDAASTLTYRDYLCSHDGSAYGVKQKIGQFNLIGRLPLHNLYAAGQSALLPGVVGAMMSSLIVGRSIIGKDRYGRLLGGVS